MSRQFDSMGLGDTNMHWHIYVPPQYALFGSHNGLFDAKLGYCQLDTSMYISTKCEFKYNSYL